VDFSNKVVLITGGAGEIGHAAARAFARCNATIVVVDRDSRGEAVAAEICAAGGRARFIAADVTRFQDVERYVNMTLDAYGVIDCFLNNAGIEGRVAPIAEYDEADFDAVMAVNVKGVFLGLRYVLPVMIRQRAGAIVNTSSTAGLKGASGLAPYIASKHAVLGLTRSAALEVSQHGVRVNAICPGPVDTRMIQSIETQLNIDDPLGARQRGEAAIPTRRYSTPDEVANVMLFLCSDLATNMAGSHVVIDGGRTA
jgi:NAD(P)-dependent dehydrogenase (short-subunit alcohol dehydrogenase family)